MASCQAFYYTKAQKEKVWEDFFFVITGQDYPCQHIDQWPRKTRESTIALATKKNQRLSRACIVHLVIKKNNWSYVKTMSCSGSHLGITINIKNTKFVKDLPMIDAQFRFNQCNSFREEYISVFSPYGSVLILWPVVAAILDFRSA